MITKKSQVRGVIIEGDVYEPVVLTDEGQVLKMVVPFNMVFELSKKSLVGRFVRFERVIEFNDWTCEEMIYWRIYALE